MALRLAEYGIDRDKGGRQIDKQPYIDKIVEAAYLLEKPERPAQGSNTGLCRLGVDPCETAS